MALETYEREELQFVLRRLRPGDTFIDVGAHLGYFTLPSAQRVGPRGSVLAIEPTASSVEILKRNVALNRFDCVKVIEAAAAADDGEAEFVVSSISPMWNKLRREPLGGDVTTVVVAAKRLDTVVAEAGWPPIAGIKLDVEGAESEVLRGSSEILARNPGIFILFEMQGEGRAQASLDTLELLREQGFAFSRPIPGGVVRTEIDELVRSMKRPAWQDSLLNVVAART